MTMRDVPTMIRTSQANRRMRHLALCLGAAAFVGLFWALVLLAMWRAV